MFNLTVFSLNRACQLDAFLRSWRQFFHEADPTVLYCYTSEAHRRAYDLCRDRHGWAHWSPQVHFRVDTLAAVNPALPYTAFFVDDMIVRRPIQWDADLVTPLIDPEVATVSLRMSPKINRCYSLGCASPPPPMTQSVPWHTWTWPNQAGDWGYPMSLDGNIFRTEDILDRMEKLAWSNPNSLEGSLSGSPIQRWRAACRAEHSVLNIPANLVQSDYRNRTCGGPSADELCAAYRDGRVIDLGPLLSIENTAPHTEAEYRLVPWNPSES